MERKLKLASVMTFILQNFPGTCFCIARDYFFFHSLCKDLKGLNKLGLFYFGIRLKGVSLIN